MAKMSKDVIEFITNTRPGLVATVSKDGVPNVAPKGSLTVVDEETILFADLLPGKTRNNIAENPNVAIAFVDGKTMKGYQIKGKSQSMKDGKVYDETCKRIAALPMKLPKPNAAVVIKVQEVYVLTPGPDAGKRL
ncbi:MAG: pyridoxamine 5'-phosphate oxidase family protein [Methanomassiliicoccales archaeon]|nr:pyridoxamine 5'-phosphate oxidase family protein [Methanomassiliicoccales archaeon]MDD1773194.1 pyridoxamine 5'-phosphate oxidase family protein [Methanomassiliicoccales archaeon]